MAIPTFNGEPIFGAAPSVVPGDPNRDFQQNAYPGVPGVEELDAGSRTMLIEAKGIMEGDGELGLFANEQYFRSYRDNNIYTLTDTLGGTWTNVALRRFTPQGDSSPGADGVYCRAYTATFEKIG